MDSLVKVALQQQVALEAAAVQIDAFEVCTRSENYLVDTCGPTADTDRCAAISGQREPGPAISAGQSGPGIRGCNHGWGQRWGGGSFAAGSVR